MVAAAVVAVVLRDNSAIMTRLFHNLSALLILCVSMGVGTAMAHDANVSTIKVIRQPSNSWVFELHTPLHGLDEAMRQFNNERSTDPGDLAKDSTRYKELIVDYVKSNFILEPQINDGHSGTTRVSLGTGRMKLGEHASVLMFDIQNMPETVNELTLHLAYMGNNPAQQNILWLIDDERRQRYVLRADNNFTIENSDFFNSTYVSTNP